QTLGHQSGCNHPVLSPVCRIVLLTVENTATADVFSPLPCFFIKMIAGNPSALSRLERNRPHAPA
ncbi:MAG: hypothetical protein LBV12_08160, partial [Puniceicoccales bacterium]|nr:hypothetical protein [Puniceicoccales bacterium]